MDFHLVPKRPQKQPQGNRGGEIRRARGERGGINTSGQQGERNKAKVEASANYDNKFI